MSVWKPLVQQIFQLLFITRISNTVAVSVSCDRFYKLKVNVIAKLVVFRHK